MKNNSNAELSAQLQKYITERSIINGGDAKSMEELNQWVAEFMDSYNRRTLAEFEGYSPEQMESIIHDQWEENSIVTFKRLDDADFEQIPIFRQFMCLIDIIKRDGKIKLTATGALPVKLVSEIYKQGVPDEDIERDGGKIRLEAECLTAELTHVLAKFMRIIKEQKGVMTLTKSGEKLIENKQTLLELMVKTFSTEFNFAYFDMFESEETAILGNVFSLILLSKYGNEKRSYKFYAEKYFAAFPTLLDDFSSIANSDENWAERCYERRTFEVYFANFGLIEREETGSILEDNIDIMIKRSSLFDKLFQIKPADK